MNDNHAEIESEYKSRWIAPSLRQAAEEHPVVILSGARQVGKSTLLQEEMPFSKWRYLTLDNYDTLGQAEREPEALWAGTGHVVIDEVQKSPSLLSTIKQVVDQRKRKVRFVLSGSTNLSLLHNASESLAGRAVYLTLFPMTWGEISGGDRSHLLETLFSGNFPAEDQIREKKESPSDEMIRGFFPPVLTFSRSEGVLRWWEGYIATYLERDLRQIASVESLSDFRRVMKALALRSGNVLNQTEIARDTGISQSTIHRYTNLVEVSSLLTRVPAFSRNRTKRLIKSPKVYWVDPALAAYLSGYHEPKALDGAREGGALFETLVFLHLQILSSLMVPRPRISYWRTVTGTEVDFVLEWGKSLVAVEVKRTTTPRYADTLGLQDFMKEYPETVAGLLVHGGTDIRRLHEKIVAVPWNALS